MAIKVLAPDVAAKIAAGEVVERPSSVVKELLENSLDAGATQITIEVQGGGTQLIRVTDDGKGIPAQDVKLAFHRHATSKLSKASDLDSVVTMGFRGEALPSIASVARVSIVTRPPDAEVGREVHLRWGEEVRSGPKGCPQGTSVAVQGLFENVPARRKFLKSPSGERARISDMVTRYALAFPEVGFRLVADGRNTITSPGNGSLADALVSVYGADTAGSLLEMSWEDTGDGYGVRGFISSPSMHRANRTYITFLVNRRWIQSPLLSFALAESYQGFLPERRHPLAVLNLSVPLAEADVNVHPAKREVRFHQESRVFSALQRGVRAALVAFSPVPEMSSGGAPTAGAGPTTASTAAGYTPSTEPMWGGQQRSMPLDSSLVQGAPTPVEAMSSLRILGQIRNTYLVAEGPDGMYLLDQHAAHERVLFEKVSREVADQTPQSQALLEPESVELSLAQEEMVQSSAGLLERFGFILEPFGERTYLLRALPAVVTDAHGAKALLEVLDLMTYEGLLREREEALAASIACHSAVRAGMGLSQVEMEELIHQLQSCDSPHTCPHGRPTIVHLSSHHLEREFGRR